MKTNKYNNMISTFQCDFSLAKEDDFSLAKLDSKIKESDSHLL